MPADVIMPRLGLTMEEGTVVAWRVKPGETVAIGQVLLEVETDKVAVEVEAKAAGVLGPVLVGAGERVTVGTLLARLYAPGEQIGQEVELPGVVGTAADSERPVPKRNWSQEASQTTAVVTTRQRLFSSPRARKRARELTVDWRQLAGSGPAGRVVERDVVRHAALRADAGPVSPSSPPLPWMLSADVALAALLAFHPRLATFVAAEGREGSAGLQVALVDWLILATVRALAIPLGLGVMLLTPAQGALPVWETGNDSSPMLRQIAQARGTSPKHRDESGVSLPKADRADLACILVVDLSHRRAATAQITPVAPQLAVVTLGQMRADKQSATLTLSGDGLRLPWVSTLDLFDHLVAFLEDPLELLT